MVAALLNQDEIWINAEGVHDLATMDPDHRANLIPFLRGNAETIRSIADEYDTDESTEDWLEAKPLMRRLCELEQGRSFTDRRATRDRNVAHEVATGYQKVRFG